jgi:antitoxin ParD1/3/4
LTLVRSICTAHHQSPITAKTPISPTDDHESHARSLVETGQHPSLSAVLQRESEMQNAELQSLRSLIDQHRAGTFVDLDTGEARTRALLTAKRVPYNGI